ncbi:MAG TPA: hypothetical protein VKA06_04865 [Spirochaetia bacterium]|nr:hypothetical protein [Spirochaetia bacterium]
MHLHRSSRIDFRKSLRSILLVLILVPALAWAQIDHSTELQVNEDYLEVNITVDGAEPEPLFANLEDGLSASIEYMIRVVEPVRRPWQALGSRVLHEFLVKYELIWDPFRERFTISTHDGAFYTFRDEADVWAFFFRLSDFRIPWTAFSDSGEPGRIRIETRAMYEPIVFVSGLSILSIFLPHSRYQSSWQTLERGVGR